MSSRLRLSRYLVLLSLLASLSTGVAAPLKRAFHKDPPDLTQGGKPDDTLDWRLGPIGASGWCFNRTPGEGASARARQIVITAVDKKGPAAGKLQVNDVILGIGQKKFSSDARKVLAAAINESEKEENKGLLKLLVWRGGSESQVALTLPVLGSYSPTMPYNCKKTEKIIDNACVHMKTRKLKPGWIDFIDGLGMMATGREDLMPQVKELAHAAVVPGEVLSLEKHVGMKCWDWSYKTLFLCEYYLATKDPYVLPTIQEYATKIAMGQSGAGTWGHTYAAMEYNEGKLHGHLGGYGAINQQGLTLMIVLPLAEKCGVNNNEVKDAIKRGDQFFSFFIGKGTIPYGDHGAANTWYDDNGKSGSAAIFFDLMGNRKGTQFFSEMILASAQSGREAGHCGCFWSHLWGGIGALRGGDLALQTYMQDMNWAFTLERQPDGWMAYQGNAGEGGNLGDPKTKWDCTGSRLLQLCAPRRTLYITGKATPKETHLTPQRIEQIRLAGRLDVDKDARAALDVPKIMELLQDPLPPTRAIGARLLAERNLNVVDQLIPMLESKNKYARYGAAEALCKAGFGSQAAADKLISLMETDTDVTFKVYAIDALVNRDKKNGLLSVAKPAIPALLRMAGQHFPDDPRSVLQCDIGRALLYSGKAQPRRGLLVEYGLEGVDRTLLREMIQEMLKNKNGATRSLCGWIYPKLTDEDLKALWADIYPATRNIAPSGIMFASGVQVDGLKLMAKQRTKEGLELTVRYVRHQNGHGSTPRMPQVMDILLQYGGHAKKYIPELQKHLAYWESQRVSRKGADPTDPASVLQATIEKIQAMKDPAPEDKLVSIGQYIKKE